VPDCALLARPAGSTENRLINAQPTRASRAASDGHRAALSIGWPTYRGMAPSHSAQSAPPARDTQIHETTGNRD
jgi:hypothetical protein